MPVEKLSSRESGGSTQDGSSAGRSKDAPSSRTDAIRPGVQAVVGIVASAGGLNAFTQFLQAMPVDSGIVFVLIPHLAPQHESYMASLAGALLGLKAIKAGGGMVMVQEPPIAEFDRMPLEHYASGPRRLPEPVW